MLVFHFSFVLSFHALSFNGGSLLIAIFILISCILSFDGDLFLMFILHWAACQCLICVISFDGDRRLKAISHIDHKMSSDVACSMEGIKGSLLLPVRSDLQAL